MPRLPFRVQRYILIHIFILIWLYRKILSKNEVLHVRVVQRSASGNFPVYTKLRRDGGEEVTTWVRKIEGDHEAFAKELRLICEAPVRVRTGIESFTDFLPFFETPNSL